MMPREMRGQVFDPTNVGALARTIVTCSRWVEIRKNCNGRKRIKHVRAASISSGQC